MPLRPPFEGITFPIVLELFIYFEVEYEVALKGINMGHNTGLSPRARSN